MRGKGKKITKKSIGKHLTGVTGLSYSDSEDIINIIINCLKTGAEEGVSIKNFGKFKRTLRKTRRIVWREEDKLSNAVSNLKFYPTKSFIKMINDHEK